MQALRFGVLALVAVSAEAQVATYQCILPGITDRRTTPSGACMMCHDGRIAKDARLGHHFDVAYPPPMRPDLRGNPTQFNPAVILVDGKVACVSCHDPASTRQNHLAAPTDGPLPKRLCVACHLFD